MTGMVVLIVLALALSFLCVLLESVLLSTSLTYIAERADAKDATGISLAKLREDPGEAVNALDALNVIGQSLAALLTGALVFRYENAPGVFAVWLGLLVVLLLLCGSIPRAIGASFWRSLAPFAARAIPLLMTLLRPISLLLAKLAGWIGGAGKGTQRLNRAQIEILTEMERREGGLQQEELEAVANLINLDQITVGEVMTPRTEMVAIPQEATVREAMDLMLEEGHLRVPVYEETIDRIVAVLLARDLWRAAREGIEEIRGIVRPARYVPFTKPVEHLIREMREQRIKMAIVLDEFGGTAGLVTLEDLIEEIIGEIQDEHEQEPLPFEEEMAGEIRIRGDVPLWEVNERFELDLPEETYDTLGGFVFGELGRVPDVGDETVTRGGRFRVVAMDGRRISRVAFVPDPLAEPTSGSE